MTLHAYQVSRELFAREDIPFYAMIMACMRRADDANRVKLRAMWPEIWDELSVRYNTPGGFHPMDENQRRPRVEEQQAVQIQPLKPLTDEDMMNYLGGKHRQGPKIAEYVLSVLRPGDTYIEPFCGAMGVAYRVAEDFPVGARMLLSDQHWGLVTMWKALIDKGWIPPDHVPEPEYLALKEKKDPTNPLTAYAGFGFSFAATYFASYAKAVSAKRTDLTPEARAAMNMEFSLRSGLTLKEKTLFKASRLREVGAEVITADYKEYADFEDCVFYLDPPYAGKSKQSEFEWDADAFWEFARKLSIKNTVFVTEFEAPPDFVSVWNFGDTVVRPGAAGKDLGDSGTEEHIFVLDKKVFHD